VRIVVTTEQIVVRKYVVEAPGHCAARAMVEAHPHQFEEQMRWQASGPEHVRLTEKEQP
jgi:hypothetical protein